MNPLLIWRSLLREGLGMRRRGYFEVVEMYQIDIQLDEASLNYKNGDK